MKVRRIHLMALTLSGVVAGSLFLLNVPGTERAPIADRFVAAITPAMPVRSETGEINTSPAPRPTPAPSAALSIGTLSVGAPAKAALPPRLTEATPTQREPYDRSLRVGKGDTLMAMLTDAGVARREAHQAITALSKLYNPRRLRPGQEISIRFEPSPTPAAVTEGAASQPASDRFAALTISADIETDFTVARQTGETSAFVAKKINRPLETRHAMSRGEITSSLYVAAVDAGLPVQVLMDMVGAFSWDVDFQRDIQKGDRFEVLYETLYTQDGELGRHGEILYAELILSGDAYPIYRHELADGAIDYFNDKGQSTKKALMRTPINGARLSSRYGKRRHPVLGYTKMHRGVDFAAPPGTPIYAAGDGVIEKIGRNGGYGKYVRIRHNSEYATAYAHMRSFAKGMTRNKRVRQKQIIGYVGTTGRSTGPHLHFEIMRNGRQTNPLRVKMPSGRKLKGAELARFIKTRDRLNQAFATTRPATPTKVAQAN